MVSIKEDFNRIWTMGLCHKMIKTKEFRDKFGFFGSKMVAKNEKRAMAIAITPCFLW